MLNRFTSPLSTLGAILCFIPAAPQILGSVGIYLLILAPFAITIYGSALVKKFVLWLDREDETEDKGFESRDRAGDD